MGGHVIAGSGPEEGVSARRAERAAKAKPAAVKRTKGKAAGGKAKRPAPKKKPKKGSD